MALSRVLIGTLCAVVFVQLAAARGLFQADCEDDTCMDEFAKCAGTDFNSSMPCCEEGHSCVVKNYFYAQCLTEERATINVANGWDGTILTDCEEMPEDVIGGPMDSIPTRKLHQDDMGSYGGMDCEDDVCGEKYDKCGGGFNVSTPCCDPETSCVVKNWFYAQCLTEERAALNVANEGWDGRVLMCEEMPEDAAKGPLYWEFNKTVDDVEYDVGRRKLQQMMESDCEDDTCVDTFEKCGGKDFNVSVPCCEATSMCVVKNWYYAQCLSASRAEENVALWGWDGRTLECEEMPEDLKPVAPGPARRLLAGEYGSYGDYGTGKGDYGDAPMPAYGDRAIAMEAPGPVMADAPATKPFKPGMDIKESPLVIGEGCEQCAPIFGQCGDKGALVSCCGDGLQCTKKHGFYAQCLTPERAERNVDSFGWDGAVLTCGEMMI